MAATYDVHVDWDADGTFTGPYDKVTARTLDDRTQVTCAYGRDSARTLTPMRPGDARLELNNRDRLLSPENSSSALYDKVIPGRDIRIQGTLGGTAYTLFRGFTDDVDFDLAFEGRSVPMSCADPMSRLKGIAISTGMYQGIRTGDALRLILDAVGWSPSLRDIDPGATVISWWWLETADAYDAAMELLDSEGPAALLTADSAGRIVFRDRHHRLTRTASQTIQSTWRASGIEPTFSAPASYVHGWKDVINSVAFDVPVRVPSPAPVVIWTAPSRISIASGETLPVTVKGSGPFIAAILPVVNVDYTAVGTVAIAMTKTDGESTTLYLTAPSGAAAVDNLQVRGQLLQATTTVVTVEDGASITKYGRRTSTSLRQPVWANPYDAAAIATLIVGARAERLPAITVTMAGGNDVRLLQQFTRNLSDRIHLVEPHTGLDADCWINQISHTVSQGGTEHRTAFALEKVPTAVATPFTFDVAGRGFNDGLFAQAGSDNPSTMFLFDQAGRGFDQGVFCT